VCVCVCVCTAVGSSKCRKSANEVGLASNLNLVLRCFVSVTCFEYVDKGV
jgi:hypothetical protein